MGKMAMRSVMIFRTKNINTPKSPNSRVQSTTGISWSECLGFSFINKWTTFPLANGPTYGSENSTYNRITGWDDEETPIPTFLSLRH